MSTFPSRFIGLDVHKHYLVAVGVDADQQQVFGPRKASLSGLDSFISKHLRAADAVVIEMSTNTWQMYDRIAPHVHSVTVVHPPHVALITRARVKTDQKAALTLAQLLAAGLLEGIWVPPKEVRDLRALIAQRAKMQRLVNQAKNRLHSLLHVYSFELPDCALFSDKANDWWLNLPISTLELCQVRSNLDTLHFAQYQVKVLTKALAAEAAKDERRCLC